MIAELRTKASSMVEFAKISFANGSAKAELKNYLDCVTCPHQSSS